MKKRDQLRISKDFVKRLEDIGLTKVQISELRDMDRDSAVEWIKQFQKRIPKAPQSFTPEIGKHIEWIDIVEMVFRVLDFDRNGTSIDLNKGVKSIKSRNKFEPYGYLLVESPTLNQPARLPIIHNNDFWLASSVFDEPFLAEGINGPDAELLVTYAPKSMWRNGKTKNPWHVLHYVLTPRGTLEQYYSDDEKGSRRMSIPEPQLLFGPFVYTGEVAVGSNDNPVV